jgi:hypothetical protein
MDHDDIEEMFSVKSWLNAYVNSVKQMDEIESADEKQEDYLPNNQAYPDYLDYVDEWKWAQQEQYQKLFGSLILTLSKKNQKIQCNCSNIHTLTTIVRADCGDTVTDGPTATIYSTCWFQTLKSKVK